MSKEPPSFATVEEELQYYKQLAQSLDDTLTDTRFTLEEFQQSSKELEEELEKEIDSTERRYNEIKARNEAMRMDVDSWKEKYHSSKKESNDHIIQLSRELENLRQQTEQYRNKERELEQDNDDLERTERAAKWSLMELETKYNRAIEKTAMLENEIESKANLVVEMQRLKDELRDANVELSVLKTNQAASNSPNGSSASLSSYSGSASSLVAAGTPKSPTIASHEAMPSLRARLARSGAAQRSYSGSLPTATSSTSVSRHAGITGTAPHSNPVQMVQEMVGRVKSLEARLVSCRSLVTPLLQPPPSYSTSIPVANRATLLSNSSVSSATSNTSSSRPQSPSKIGRRTSLLQQQQHQQQQQQRSLTGSGVLTST